MIAMETTSTAARALDRMLGGATPAEIVAAAVRETGRDRLAVVSSFGAESAALLQVVADVDPAIPVLFIDTEWLFPETLAYRDLLIARLGLGDVRTIRPREASVAARDPDRDLWASDPDACCSLRKVVPLEAALAPFDGWINGRKRFHGGERATLPVVEADGDRLKFNPLAHVAPAEIEAMFRSRDLPRHPLVVHGFSSIGCMPCTSRAAPGQGPRSGRWQGRAKTECGIHGAAKGQ